MKSTTAMNNANDNGGGNTRSCSISLVSILNILTRAIVLYSLIVNMEQAQSMTLPFFMWSKMQKRQQQQQCHGEFIAKMMDSTATTPTGSGSGGRNHRSDGHTKLVPVQETLLFNYQSSRYDLFPWKKLQRKFSSQFLTLYKQWIVENATRTTRQINHSAACSSADCRTRFMFKLPSPQELYRIMFEGIFPMMGDEMAHEDWNHRSSRLGFLAQQSHIMSQFNHDCVGMTRPILSQSTGTTRHEGVIIQQPMNISYQLDTFKNTLTIAASDHGGQNVVDSSLTKDNDDDDDDDSVGKLWWPKSQHEIITSSVRKTAHHGDSEIGRMAWRVKRYRKRVGRGSDCYDRVRNAVLDWEFQHNQWDDNDYSAATTAAVDSINTLNNGALIHRRKHNDMGIQRVVPNSASVYKRGGFPLLEENINPNVLQICNSIFSPTHKNLVTYTQVHLVPFHETLEKIGKSLLLQCRKNDHVGQLGHALGKLVLGFENMLPTLYVINPVRVIYDIVDEQSPNGDVYTCTAYATLGGHFLRGEERVCVILRGNDASHQEFMPPKFATRSHEGEGGTLMPESTKAIKDHGCVDVEILSYSKPAANIFGLLVWPFIREKQENFFQSQLKELERVAFHKMKYESLTENSIYQN